MSTRLTKDEVTMVDSHSLQLVFACAKVQEQISHNVAIALEKKGYEGVTPSVLNFLSAMDCGVNFASDIARNLGVSRQMVAKTVKELCAVGYLRQEEGEGKQKPIHFTELGTQLIADSRAELAFLDSYLDAYLGKGELKNALGKLEEIVVAFNQQ